MYYRWITVILNMNKKKKTFELLEKVTKSAHGWTSSRELASLYYSAKAVDGRGVIVEIGSWQGRSTIWIAQGSKDGANMEVYAIDPFTGSVENQRPGVKVWTLNDFNHNLASAGVQDIVKPVVSTSENASKEWNKQIEFLFIDGDHEYEAAKKDFLLFSQHVINGGTIAFHDTTPNLKAILNEGLPIFGLSGPRKVVEEYIFKSNKFKNINLVGSIIYATKCDNNSYADRLKGKMCQLKMISNYFMYGFYSKLKKLPNPIKTFLKKLLKT